MGTDASRQVVEPTAPFGADRTARHSAPRVTLGVVAVCSFLVLSGCAMSAAGFAVLEREPHANDAVPTELPSDSWEHADPATARFIADHDDTRLWLLRGTNDGDVCLLLYPDDGEWVIGCGGTELTVGGRSSTFTVVPDGTAIPDGATVISENVYTAAADTRR